MESRLSQTGQSASPFELLVAVIIMTFIILIGSQAMAALKEQQCMSEIKKYMQEFKFALEKIVGPNKSQTLAFTPPACYKNEEITLKYLEAEPICSSVCQQPGKKGCVLLSYYSPEASGFSMCVNVPITTYLEDDATCSDLDPSQSIQTLPSVGIGEREVIRGFYEFVDITAGDAFPKVCVYRITG